jgi:sulfite reductase (NADPH) hemoprotein beta-component
LRLEIVNRNNRKNQKSKKMPSEVEHIKTKSNYLRGTIRESLDNDVTGALYNDDIQLIKFHGSYQQADRDLDTERKRQKLEPLFSYMLRIRLAGGVATAAQWLRMDELADKFGNGTMKLTTRQAFQLHGILKRHLKKTIQGFNAAFLDSIAGCGDVNRNVMCNPNPYESAVHTAVFEDSVAISAHLTPKSSAYWELWLEGEGENTGSPVLTKKIQEDDEPIYGKTYLPRKFKIALAIPPYNDVDVFANDIGLIAIEKDGKLLGYNVAAGGGFGMTFGMPETYPRLAEVLGFVPADKVVDVCEHIVTIQRDWGNRENRKFSRLKYTMDRVGTPVFIAELNKRLGFDLLPAKPYKFQSNGDAYGWSQNLDKTYNLTLFIEGGRVKDDSDFKLKTALREVAKIHEGDFRLTGNQNLVIGAISSQKKAKIEEILNKYGVLKPTLHKSGMRLNSLACVSLPTCTQAFAEAERYLPDLMTKIELILKQFELDKEAIVIRMTGCPNGCARPFLGEIGLIGKSLGRYNLYLGAAHDGSRMNKLYREMLDEKGILEVLTPIFEDYSRNRLVGEHFGDFTIRKEYVKATVIGLDFHS